MIRSVVCGCGLKGTCRWWCIRERRALACLPTCSWSAVFLSHHQYWHLLWWWSLPQWAVPPLYYSGGISSQLLLPSLIQFMEIRIQTCKHTCIIICNNLIASWQVPKLTLWLPFRRVSSFHTIIIITLITHAVFSECLPIAHFHCLHLLLSSIKQLYVYKLSGVHWEPGNREGNKENMKIYPLLFYEFFFFLFSDATASLSGCESL